MSRRVYFLVCCLTLASIFTGCDRTFDNTVEFKGKVYYGSELDAGNIAVLGPLPNARVIVIGYQEYATTDSMGRYSLSIKTPRKFNDANGKGDIFTLEASGTSSTSVYPQGNYVSEQIAVYGRSGDTVQVRDFLVYAHKEEDSSD